jgi:hypothetical protein
VAARSVPLSLLQYEQHMSVKKKAAHALLNKLGKTDLLCFSVPH